MKCRTRTYYTATQKALMWERWKDGWTLKEIGKLFDRGHTTFQKNLGGQRRHAPTLWQGSPCKPSIPGNANIRAAAGRRSAPSRWEPRGNCVEK